MVALVVVVIIVVVAAAVYAVLNLGSPGNAGSSSTAISATWYALTLQAGGSTFVNPIMQVWATAFSQYTNGQVQTNYQALGSSSGISGVTKNIFAFAGSDATPTASQLGNSTGLYGPLLQIPETLGGVAMFYNIPGVTVSLNMTGQIIADIYLGKITTWNDSAIQSINPGMTLPGKPIVPVRRSDGSGTTFALTNYLQKTSTDWNASWSDGQISSSGCPCFSTGPFSQLTGLASKGSGGVSGQVQTTPYSIGYADSYYAFSNNLKAAAILNKAGKFLVPTLDNIAAAANDFSTQVQNDPTFAITNAPGANSYPIATYTYLLVWQNQDKVSSNLQTGYDTAQFMWWIVNQGQAYGPPLYYPKLPASVVTIDESIIEKIQFNGVPLIHG